MPPDRLEQLWNRVANSPFCQRFKLREADLTYLRTLDPPTLDRHIHEILTCRLGPAYPTNDGRQTPMRGKPRGHPVFLAQHATATCCRHCLAKWHGIASGQAMSKGQIDYASEVVKRWLNQQGEVATAARDGPNETNQPSLFTTSMAPVG